MDKANAIALAVEWIRRRGYDYPIEGLVADRFEVGWTVYAPVEIDESDPMSFLDIPVGRMLLLVGDSGRIVESSSSVPPGQAEARFTAQERAVLSTPSSVPQATVRKQRTMLRPQVPEHQDDLDDSKQVLRRPQNEGRVGYPAGTQRNWGRQLPSPVVLVLLGATFALVGNLATNTVQVSWRWWPVLVWAIAGALVVASGVVEWRRHRLTPLPEAPGNLDDPHAVTPPPARSIPEEVAKVLEATGRHPRDIPGLEEAIAKGAKVVKVGRHPRDIPHLMEAIAIFEKQGDSTNALPFRHDLAAAYQSAGRLDEAIIQLQQVVDGYTRLWGLGHLDTLTSRNDLAAALLQAGRLDEAVDLLEQVVEQARVLGIGHPKTLAFRGNLAGAYQLVGRLDEAIDLGRQVLAECERHPDLGPTHALTVSVRRNLEKARRDRG